MVELRAEATTTIHVTVEFFGLPRIITGRKEIHLEVGSQADSTDLAALLAEEYPDLVGRVIREDPTGFQESYVLNRNGTEFLTAGPLDVRTGDRLLLFSSQAGG